MTQRRFVESKLESCREELVTRAWVDETGPYVAVREAPRHGRTHRREVPTPPDEPRSHADADLISL